MVEQPVPVPSPEEQRQLIELLFYLFHREFAVAENLTAEQKPQTLPVYFLGWLGTKIDLMNGQEVCESAGLPYTIWDHLLNLVGDPVAPERLRFSWPQITMADRKPLTVAVKRVTSNLIVEYADGSLFVQQQLGYPELTEHGRIDDGLLGTMLGEHHQGFLKTLQEAGLDGMRREANDFGGEEPFNILMGAMLQILPQLKPQYHENIRCYMRLCQMMIQPPLPPHVKAAMAQAQRKHEPDSNVARGGWDV